MIFQRILSRSLTGAALALLLAVSHDAQAGASVKNLSVDPTCYSAGDLITVTFQVKGEDWRAVKGGIVFSTGNNYDWDDDAVDDSGGAENPPVSTGHWGETFATMGAHASWTSVTRVITVPSGYTGTMKLIVGVAADWFGAWSWGGNIEGTKRVDMSPCAVSSSPTNTPLPATPTRTATPSMTLPGTRTNSPTLTITTNSTRTNTPTPTRTPTGVIAYQGLQSAERLYGLEYIPFPYMLGTTLGTFYDLSFAANSLASNNVPRNTARYRVVLQGMNGQVQVETRIGPYGVTCTTGYFNSANYLTATSLTLPSRPQNLSTTYAWVGTTPPETEQLSAMGDPRHTPYLDSLSLSNTAYQDSYNWFYKNMATTTFQDYHTGYAAFLANADWDHYNGRLDADIPKLYRLWREGLYTSRSIFNSVTGWSNYYAGLGGEIGGDSNNKLAAGGVPMSSRPYGGTGTGTRYEEIIGSTVMVRSSTWDSLPILGELWPDNLYTSDWSSAGTMSSWGNLRNSQSSGVAYRDRIENVSQTGRYSYVSSQHVNNDKGCQTFMNGNDGTTAANSFNHGSIGATDLGWLYDAQKMSGDYNFTMSNVFSVSRPWNLNSGAATAPEWGYAPYNANRALLNVYSASTQTATSSGFYNDATTGASRRGSATVRGLWNNMVAYFVISGLNTSTDTGINFVARFSLISCLRTFHDAGAPAKNTDGVYNGKAMVTNNNIISGTSYRIEPIPYVAITKPTDNEDKSGQGFIQVNWTERYARWDGQRYTESYPCVDDVDRYSSSCQPSVISAPGNPNLEWHSLTGTALVYNVKYSMDNGSTWYSALTDVQCDAGSYVGGLDSIDGNGTYKYALTWDVTGLPAGTKLLRVECYRKALGQHYAFHEIHVVTNP